MAPPRLLFYRPASCTWLGDFVLAHASGKKCELVILFHSRVPIRDQMARRELLCRYSERRRQSVLGCRVIVEYFLLLMLYWNRNQLPITSICDSDTFVISNTFGDWCM